MKIYTIDCILNFNGLFFKEMVCTYKNFVDIYGRISCAFERFCGTDRKIYDAAQTNAVVWHYN